MPPGPVDKDIQNLFYNKKFNDPFLLNSNLYIPRDFYTALEFALYLAIKNPLYTQAAKRTVAYFLTDIEYVGKSGDQRERDELREYLTDELDLFGALAQCGLEQYVYGNSFLRVHYPFDRYLVDRRDGYRLYKVQAFGDDIRFNLKDMTYNVPDPKTAHLPADQRTRVDLEFMDRKNRDMNRIALRVLNPMRMMLNMNFISGHVEYIYRFEEFFRAAVQKGEPIHQIHETPIEMLKAIRNNQDFKFNPGTIIHFKEPFISGLSYNGWGIPNILLNYNAIHQVQVLRCINEAVGLDYMLPFRLISPSGGGAGGSDVAAATNIGRWTAAMSQLIAHKRQDPTALHTVPFPVTYQELGANGKALAPVDLIQAMQNEVLDGFGYPSELWHMTMQFQAVPTAIRLFEMTNIHLMRTFNQATKHIVRSILDYLEREQMGVKLARPRVADDLEKKHIYLQLASGGELSRATAYRAFNIDDPIEEKRRRMQEDIEIQKVEKKENENFEREMTLGSANQVVDAMLQAQQAPPPGGGGGGGAPAGPPPGGGGGGGGPSVFMDGQNVTPLELENQAQAQAEQLLSMPTGERRKAMNSLKATNPVLYAVTQRKMEDMRQQGASQGRASVEQQMQGG